MAPRPPIPFEAVPVLALLRPEDRAALAPACELSAYEKGAVVFEEGSPADRIHFLVRGRVKIVKAGPDRDLIIDLLGPGEPLGAVAVFEHKPFPATAVAIAPSAVLSVPEGRFFRVIEQNPEITRRLLAGLTLRLITLNRRLADMTGSVEYRCARLFETLAAKMGRQEEGGAVFVPLPLSRQEIADLAGTTIETAIRVMSRWQKGGVLETDPTGFRIHDPAALREIAPEE